MFHSKEGKLGLAGRIASTFVDSKLTPLIVLAAIFLGLMAIWLTPREEEPQIEVPMIDILIPFPGATPKEVEERITTTAEKLLWGIPNVEYIYSTSRQGVAFITVRFEVGSDLEESLVKVHHKCRENAYNRPVGAMQPLIRAYTIDDVPFLALTLHSRKLDDFALRKVALDLRNELSEIPNIRRIDVIGGRPRQVRIKPDPAKLKKYHVSIAELFQPLLSGNVQGVVGTTKDKSPEWLIDFNAFFSSAKEVGDIVVGLKGGRPVYLHDVAEVTDGPAERASYVLFARRGGELESAVTLSLAKRPGTNATFLAKKVIEKTELVKKDILPDGVEISITRNYGKTAKQKSDELIFHVFLASISVTILIAIFLGIRFSAVVAIAVPVTLALTLMIYYLLGYTLNRVTLFALIFSIGILVDDAIVVVENVQRHLTQEKKGSKKFRDVIVAAVDEVGNPTILATFTVIAAILPMGFVRGLMGPYMRPIPVGASMAMLFSLAIAFMITPWATNKIYRPKFEEEEGHSLLDRIYCGIMDFLLKDRLHTMGFGLFIVVLLIGAMALVGVKLVRVKMLPFDNKSEFQVVVDLDEGARLEDTLDVLKALSKRLDKEELVTDYQLYVGASAPFNFNGLVRHYFLRRSPHQGDIQVNLIDRHERSEQSHSIAKRLRPDLVEIGRKMGARVKVVEIPPGPPVLSTLVAEVYGPDYDRQLELAAEIKKLFLETEGVVDVDWMVEHPQDKYIISVDREKASLMRVPVDRIFKVIYAAYGGKAAGVLHAPEWREQVPLLIQLPRRLRRDVSALGDLVVPSLDGSFIPLKRLVRVTDSKQAVSIYHKNLQRVVYVIGDVAGVKESPVYAILKLNKKIDALKLPEGYKIEKYYARQPETTDKLSMKWDGEWRITYEVFRDLGIAFVVVLILIYILVVGWFESFLVPIVIMLPIPISLIGIMPAHWLINAFFTANSMIGFIAGAGIIVRNSIILVDFIELRMRQGMTPKEAVIDAGTKRFRPMLLTAGAVVVGAGVILFDPIFQGLAISLMAGEVAATILSRFAVPVLYYVMVAKKREKYIKSTASV